MNGETEKALAYIDSSALVKLILPEPESAALVLFVRSYELVASRLAAIEAHRAVQFAGGGKRLEKKADKVLATVNLVEIGPAIGSTAGTLGPSNLRTLDAIHLATALSFSGEPPLMIVYDARLKQSALSHGLVVESPAAPS